MSQAFKNELKRAGRRMAADFIQAAARVLANGGRELSRRPYYLGGPVIVTVLVPRGTWRVNGRDVRTITYRESDEAKIFATRDAIEKPRTNRKGS